MVLGLVVFEAKERRRMEEVRRTVGNAVTSVHVLPLHFRVNDLYGLHYSRPA